MRLLTSGTLSLYSSLCYGQEVFEVVSPADGGPVWPLQH